MKWTLPPIIKIYEAIGSVADGRIEILSPNSAKVYSSSGNKFYEISYSPEEKAIMANDSASYWRGYLGYPAIAFLIKQGLLSYDDEAGELLRGIPWKDINKKFNNNFDETLTYIMSCRSGEEKERMEKFVERVFEELKALDLSVLGKKQRPPSGY